MGSSLLPIGKLARTSGISVRMLRYFESVGLLKPTKFGRRRFYRADDRNHVAVIKVYQSLGFDLKTVREFRSALKADAKDEALRMAKAAATNVDLEIEALEKRRFFLERLQSKLIDGHPPHSHRCFLCGVADDSDRNWWGAKLDLFCEPCIERLHAEIGAVSKDSYARCAACGNAGKSPSMHGVDGDICYDCLRLYKENIQRSKRG